MFRKQKPVNTIISMRSHVTDEKETYVIIITIAENSAISSVGTMFHSK